MGQFKAVIVGCGGMSSVWLDCLQTIPDDVEVVGLVDMHPAAAEAKRAAYHLDQARTGADLDAVLSATRPDLVIDLTTPEAHYHVVMTALRHGCHVLGEKPLAASMQQAREMVSTAAAAGRCYAIMQNRRYHQCIRRVRRMITEGAIGPLTTVHCDFFLAPHFGGFRDQLRHVLLLDMAIHTFDAARYLSGADPVAVYCKEWNPAGSWYSRDASAIAIFEMSNGIVYSYRGSWCAEGLNTTWECDWRLIGTSGTIKWDGAGAISGQRVEAPDGFSSRLADLAVPENPEPHKDGGHGGLIRDYIQCLKSGQLPETHAADNLRSLAMVFGAIESAETGRRVEITL